MQLTQTEFRILVLVIGLIIGLALSFMLYAMTHTFVAFIFVPISMGVIYMQQTRRPGMRE